jgi:uncharacterized protein VirK/YbjX
MWHVGQEDNTCKGVRTSTISSTNRTYQLTRPFTFTLRGFETFLSHLLHLDGMLHRLYLYKLNSHDTLPAARLKGRSQSPALVASFACVKTRGTFVRCAKLLKNGVVYHVAVVEVSPAIDVDLCEVD